MEASLTIPTFVYSMQSLIIQIPLPFDFKNPAKPKAWINDVLPKTKSKGDVDKRFSQCNEFQCFGKNSKCNLFREK